MLAEFLPLGLRRSSSLKAIALSCLWDGGVPGQREGQRLFGEVFGAFFAIFCILGAFWTHLMPSWFFLPTFFDFGSILHGFWKVLEGYLEGRFLDFSHFSHKLRFCVKVNKTLRGRMNFQGRLSKKHVNFQKNARKNWWNYMVGKNKGKIHTNTEFGTVLGLSGTGLGGFWNSSGRFWPPLGRFLDVLARTFF